MAKKKVGLSKYKKIAIFSFLTLFVGISIFMYFNKDMGNQIPTLPTQNKEFPLDIVNDGIYTNYEYGFRFKYPVSIFVEQHNNGTKVAGWYNQKNIKEAFGLDYSSGIWMSIVAAESTKGLEDNFYRTYNLTIGESNLLGETKLSSIEKSDYKNVVFFRKTPVKKESEHSVSYVSIWIIDDRYLSLNVSAGENKDVLIKKYRNTFDQIVSSFEFFDPSVSPVK